jgi:hypothetical protein
MLKHTARFIPASAGLVILGLMLFGPGAPAQNLCRITRYPAVLSQYCLSLKNLPLLAAGVAAALIALTLLLLLRWQRRRPRAISYDSDAGRWVVLGWILAIGGAVSLMAGLLLIGSNGWPFSQQSRHITIRTGQLPVFISTVQRRYIARYGGVDGSPSLCAGFGAVTIANRSRARAMSLDLGLVITPHQHGRAAPHTAIPTREDLAAIARRGLSAPATFRNPVELQPRQSLRRELVFVIRNAGAGLSDRDHDFALAVTDRLSGQTVSFELPAEYRG